LIENQDNYKRVTFDALSELPSDEERSAELLAVFQAAKIRYCRRKSPLMARNYSLVARMGDPEKAREQAFAQQVREAKIACMRQFYGTVDKYARNIWMDAYHPEFHNTIAIDQRIKKETEALGYSLTNYAEHDRFY